MTSTQKTVARIIPVVWRRNKDLNFGEVRIVAEAANKAADDAAQAVRRAKAAAASGRTCYCRFDA